MVMSPQVSWLFFKARAKCPYLIHTGRANNAEKQPTGRGPEGCVENGPAAALLVGYVSIQICALFPPVRLGPPCRRPILNATPSPLYARRYTWAFLRRFQIGRLVWSLLLFPKSGVRNGIRGPIWPRRIDQVTITVPVMVANPGHRESQTVFVATFGDEVEVIVRADYRFGPAR